MELKHNSTFRIIKQLDGDRIYKPGLYRVVLDEPNINKLIVALIQPEDKEHRGRGGRRKLEAPKRKRKKSPLPLVTDLVWMDREEVETLFGEGMAREVSLERDAKLYVLKLNPRAQAQYEKRLLAMAGFLDQRILRDSILVHEGLGGLVKEAMKAANVSRAFVYKNASNLFMYGFSESSLVPRHDRAGAPGVARPCAPGGRRKAGRKTLEQKIARAYGIDPDPTQPGMSVEWAAAIRAADKSIGTPKPSWPKRCKQIVGSAFVSHGKEVNGVFEWVEPPIGNFPNIRQIRRVLEADTTRLQRVLEQTTKAHFKANLRGLLGRNWKNVAGPGHSWAIDSTVGDIYLRSTVNRQWIVGRPIVYVIVDIWSTAVVGFHVCLQGPSWDTAKVSLFNAVADPAVLGELWGYQPILSLVPHPTLSYSLEADRGEILSAKHRITAFRIIPHTSYTPPYRGDLKGLVEVLHRIEKDAQFNFIPGAMDFRRAELELKRVNPDDCVMNVREYVQYLHELFGEYNLTADRRHRVDAHMVAAGVYPSPAGLWRWGHAMGIGLQRHMEQSELISALLPESTARVRRDAVRWLKCDFMSKEVEAREWTAIARNLGGWEVPIHHYPGSMSRIWTPNVGAAGLMELRLTDQSKASPELTYEDFLDPLALETVQRARVEYNNTMRALDFERRRKDLIANAKLLTAEALAKASGAAPSMTHARQMELAAAGAATESPLATPSASEEADPSREAHRGLMASLLAAVAEGDRDA